MFFFFSFVVAQTPFELYTLSQQKLAEKDTAAFMKYAEEAYKKLGSFHPDFAVNLAKAYAMNGRKTKCIELLDDLAVLGLDYHVENDSGFMKIWNHSLLQGILERTKKRSEVIASSFAFALPEKDLIPEGIAYDPRQQKFYISSIYKRKVITLNMDGTVSDFVSEAQDGLLAVIGMKVDAARNCLWVMNSIDWPRPRTFKKEEVGNAAAFQYDIETKRLLHKYAVTDTLPHFFNDAVILANGEVYVTDSEAGTIFKIDQNTKTITQWWTGKKFIYPNGITVSPNQQYLFVAHWLGISRISIADTQGILLPAKIRTVLSGIDGLYFYNNSLIGIQNGVGPQARIMKYELSKKLDAIVSETVLESGNPHFNIPTTGVIVGDDFYFIANSQLGSFDAEGKIFSMEKLEPVYIHKLRLAE